MIGKLTKQERGVIAEKFMDWGNLAFVGLVIAQFVPPTAVLEWKAILAGVLGIISAYVMAVFLMKGGE